MNILPFDRKIQVLSALVEGASVRSVERMTGVHRDTIMRLLCATGDHCMALMDARMRDIQARQIQVDEVWTYTRTKEGHLVPRQESWSPEFGDQYIFVALDAETKLVPTFAVGKRNIYTATRFMLDLRQRVVNHCQITTDAFPAYLEAVESAFGADVDFAMLVKSYRSNGARKREGYGPSDFVSSKPVVVMGNPDPRFISTSYVERQNLTMRTQMRRLTRLTNAFSKKLANLKAAVALHFAHYNLCRIHSSLRITPAMAAGITDHVWTMQEILGWSN